jgi:hypothetical protein
MGRTGLNWTPAALWLTVVASGLYHGLNPGMGWPLALTAGLIEGSPRALMAALRPLAAGHLLAVLAVILPFCLLVALAEWHRQIQIGASLLVIGFGIVRFVNRRHPRLLARIRPTQLGLWSFAVAIAHGAGLMLVPIYLGLCAADLDSGPRGGRRPHQGRSRHRCPGLGRTLCGDGCSRRIPGVSGLSQPQSQTRVAELVQSGCDLGLQPHIDGLPLVFDWSRQSRLSGIPSFRPKIGS